MNRDGLFTLHPLTSFFYFLFVLCFAMTLRHPIYQAVSIVFALIYALLSQGKKAILLTLKYALPIIVITAFINPAFNHAGKTVLCYFPTGNPLTLESLLYGISSGIMLACVLIWFFSFNKVMTSDKFIYLFGRVTPAFSLLLSITMRFIPHFKKTLGDTKDAQLCLGGKDENMKMSQRLKSSIAVFSAAVTYSLENSVDTSDSMKSRGYGLKGRTAFSIYRFDKRDVIVLTVAFICAAAVFTASCFNVTAFSFFPGIFSAGRGTAALLSLMFYVILCALPAVLTVVNTVGRRRAGK